MKMWSRLPSAPGVTVPQKRSLSLITLVRVEHSSWASDNCMELL